MPIEGDRDQRSSSSTRFLPSRLKSQSLRVADRDMTVVLPDLLGTPGRSMTIPYALSSFARACVSKEFTLLALNKTSPIVDYLRDLAKHEHEAMADRVSGHWCLSVPHVGSVMFQRECSLVRLRSCSGQATFEHE